MSCQRPLTERLWPLSVCLFLPVAAGCGLGSGDNNGQGAAFINSQNGADAGELVVHRKGAAPASLNQPGLIPGSAGTISVHVEGRGDQRSMCSSSHGAGRLLSRSAARQSITSGDVRRQMGQVAFDRQREHSLRDEAPGAYRDLRIVMQAQHDLVKETRTLRPLVSFKASG